MTLSPRERVARALFIAGMGVVLLAVLLPFAPFAVDRVRDARDLWRIRDIPDPAVARVEMVDDDDGAVPVFRAWSQA